MEKCRIIGRCVQQFRSSADFAMSAMQFDEYVRHDAVGLADLVRKGEVHPRELLQTAMARADATASLNMIVRRLDDLARTTAEVPPRVDAPFAGVPFLVKDLFQDIAGLPSSCGSRALMQVAADEDADVVRRWKQAGLVIFGKTNTPEFGARNVTEPKAWGAARNPWNPGRTPGGSSGGSAAAVAAGVVPMAGANDGGGSIRIPAAACGLFGLKPGRGRISMGPLMAEGLQGIAVQGIVSRSVRDSATMLDVLQGPEPHAPYHMAAPLTPYADAIKTPPRSLRIGFTTASPIGTPVDAEAVRAVEHTARLLESLGHHVEEVASPVNGLQLAEDFLLAWFCAQALLIDTIKAQTGAGNDQFEADNLLMAAVGRSVSAVELLACEARWNTHNRDLARYHAHHDLWLTPTLAAPPVPLGALDTPRALETLSTLARGLGLAGVMRHTRDFKATVLNNLGWTPYTQLANLTGRPAMSVPLYWTPDELPLGVQFVAPLDGEALLLQLAAQLEQAQPWFERRPTLQMPQKAA